MLHPVNKEVYQSGRDIFAGKFIVYGDIACRKSLCSIYEEIIDGVGECGRKVIFIILDQKGCGKMVLVDQPDLLSDRCDQVHVHARFDAADEVDDVDNLTFAYK